MEHKLLGLRPTRWKCPFCGELHTWESNASLKYFTGRRKFTMTCPHSSSRSFSGAFNDEFFTFSFEPNCSTITYDTITGSIPISEIMEHIDQPMVTFPISYCNKRDIAEYSYNCRRDCYYSEKCTAYKHYLNTTDGLHVPFIAGFVFDEGEYLKNSSCGQKKQHASQLASREATVKAAEIQLEQDRAALEQRIEEFSAEESAFQNIKNEFYRMKEENAMSETAITAKKGLFRQLYEVSPQENVQLIRDFMNKHHSTFAWAVPAITVYAAYNILKHSKCDLTENNISKRFEEMMGFKLEVLDNHEKIKELMAIGLLATGAFAAVKGLSTILGTKEDSELTMTDVEDGMNKLQTASQKFDWILPRLEKLLPIACSVVLVYMTLHKPTFTGPIMSKLQNLCGNATGYIKTYWGLTKEYIGAKLKLNLDDEKDQCKLRFVLLLTAVLGIATFLYGKKVLDAKKGDNSIVTNDGKPVNSSISTFVAQIREILDKIAPTLYTTALTFISAKLMLGMEKVKPVNITDPKLIVDADQSDSNIPTSSEADAETTTT